MLSEKSVMRDMKKARETKREKGQKDKEREVRREREGEYKCIGSCSRDIFWGGGGLGGGGGGG